jgi:hypothetical protein
MKKLLMGSAALTLFSISIVIFQMSCKKDATAQTGGTSYTLPAATTSTLGGIIVGSGLSVTTNGTISVNNNSSGTVQLNKILYSKNPTGTAGSNEIWSANYDGTNQTKINVSLPAGFGISGFARLSPDGQKVFFGVKENSINRVHIYSCKIDGTNAIRVIDGTNTFGMDIEGAY